METMFYQEVVLEGLRRTGLSVRLTDTGGRCTAYEVTCPGCHWSALITDGDFGHDFTDANILASGYVSDDDEGSIIVNAEETGSITPTEAYLAVLDHHRRHQYAV